jgi:hypothetical protein
MKLEWGCILDRFIECDLVGCENMQSSSWLPTFRRDVLPPSSGQPPYAEPTLKLEEMRSSETLVTTYKILRKYVAGPTLKMEAIRCSETLITTHKTTRRDNLGDHNWHLQRRGAPWDPQILDRQNELVRAASK